MSVEDHFIAKVDNQHRITPPQHFRGFYGIEPGDYLKCEIIENLGKKKKKKVV